MISNDNLPFIETDIPDSLNFALFIRYRFIKPFPLNNKTFFIKKYSCLFDLANCQSQKKLLYLWNHWWNDLIQKRVRINQHWRIRHGIDPEDNFLSMNETPELKELCMASWDIFSKWWYDSNEGRMALRTLEKQYDFCDVIKNLDNYKRSQQINLRPFSQYIDYVFGYVEGIIDINNYYTLINITSNTSKEYLDSLILNKIKDSVLNE